MSANPIRIGMVGGGQGGFIGAVHRHALRLDGQYQLVAGALSSDPERSKASGLELGLDESRCYANYEDMARMEAAREDGIEAVSIVTPNHLHVPVAMAFLKAGIHVICDKPLSSNFEMALALKEVLADSSAKFFLTHNYSAYPMIRQARALVASGALGDIRLVQVEYVQDWLSEDIESEGQKQAAWRTNPSLSGGGAIGDIGTHAYQLASFVSGLTTKRIAAQMSTFVPSRRVDDDVQVMLQFEGGAKGMLWASQVAPGNENSLKLRVYGSQGGLEWAQEDPNYLWFTALGQPKQLHTRGGAAATEAANAVTRIPGGHPEGYLEAFASLYSEAADVIRGNTAATLVPMLEDGLKGMAFIRACQQSSSADSAWVSLA
ncbi:MAG: Gfo/Idh/MocA family oxidoreductase [Gammaproteobacteria bacterium]|nr:Gfo/Idh/MocA family oxidoreductase [Gammaproteobacteria bacterium]